MTQPLSEKEIEAYCGSLLEPVSKYIAKTMGDEASTHTGECLLTALRKFDGSRGDILSYARTKTRLLVIEACRRVNGRKGTARYAANASRAEIEDFDGFTEDANPGANMEEEESLSRALKTIDRAQRLQRVILFSRLLVGLTDKEIQGFFNVSQAKIWAESISLRQLVPSG